MEREHLIAHKGMIYTNGETYGTDITLAEGMTREGYYEIPYEEYEAINKAKEEVIE